MTQPRFHIDHDMIHDRITGKHVTTDAMELRANCQTLADTCALLNRLGEIEAAALAALPHVSRTIRSEPIFRRLADALGIVARAPGHYGDLRKRFTVPTE